jgi:hypothetical protein
MSSVDFLKFSNFWETFQLPSTGWVSHTLKIANLLFAETLENLQNRFGSFLIGTDQRTSWMRKEMCDQCPSGIFYRIKRKIIILWDSCKYSHRKTELIKMGLRRPCTENRGNVAVLMFVKLTSQPISPQDPSNPLLSHTSRETHVISGLLGTSPTVKNCGVLTYTLNCNLQPFIVDTHYCVGHYALSGTCFINTTFLKLVLLLENHYCHSFNCM